MLLLLLCCPRPRHHDHVFYSRTVRSVRLVVLVLQLVWCVVCGVWCVCTVNQTFIFCADDDALIIYLIIFIRKTLL